jgi:hypothetical protein
MTLELTEKEAEILIRMIKVYNPPKSDELICVSIYHRLVDTLKQMKR